MATAALPTSIASAPTAGTAPTSSFALSAAPPALVQLLLAAVFVLMAVASFSTGYLNA